MMKKSLREIKRFSALITLVASAPRAKKGTAPFGHEYAPVLISVKIKSAHDLKKFLIYYFI